MAVHIHTYIYKYTHEQATACRCVPVYQCHIAVTELVPTYIQLHLHVFHKGYTTCCRTSSKQDSPVTTTKPSDELLEDLICKVHVFFDKILNRLQLAIYGIKHLWTGTTTSWPLVTRMLVKAELLINVQPLLTVTNSETVRLNPLLPVQSTIQSIQLELLKKLKALV